MTRTRISPRIAVSAGFGALLALAAFGVARADEENDYPTNARADYVFACMAASGQTRDSLEHCSCSLDVLASILPFDKYVQASTVLSMRQGVGGRTATFRGVKMYDDMVADLRRAQAEAEVRCYR
jgi:hypothetical protein